jgi:dihydroorotate dehydrogenase
MILPRLLQNFAHPVSISLAKTNCERTIDIGEGIQDYVHTINLAEQLKVGDIYTLNISCPNAYGGEPYTTPELLNQLLEAIKTAHPSKPIWIKMPLELPRSQYMKLCETAIKHGVQALILSNLRKERDGIDIQ